LEFGGIDEALVRAPRIKVLHRAVTRDVEHQKVTLRDAGHLDSDARIAAVNFVVRQDAHRLRSSRGEAFEPVDGGYAVDDAGETGAVNAAGDDVPAREHIERRWIPDEIRIVLGSDHLEARLPSLQIGQKIALVTKDSDADGTQRCRA